MDNNYKTVLLVGNGFDLNLGLKTSYSHFLSSSDFKALAQTNNLCIYLENKLKLQHWIDIENELKTYSQSGNDKTFKKEFKELCEALSNYLNKLDYSIIDQSSVAYKFLHAIANIQDILIIDFNYTSSTCILLKEFGWDSSKITRQLIKIHGSIEQNNIIFGVEDKASIKDSHVFLRKAYNKSFHPIQIESSVRHLYVFGHSLGETDHSYFNNFFSYSASTNASSFINTSTSIINKRFDIYFYKDDGYDQIMKQLDSLTIHNLTPYKKNNDIHLIDVNSQLCKQSKFESLPS